MQVATCEGGAGWHFALILSINSVRAVGAFGIMGGCQIKGDSHETSTDIDVDNRFAVFK